MMNIDKKYIKVWVIIAVVVILLGLGFYFKTDIQKKFSTQEPIVEDKVLLEDEENNNTEAPSEIEVGVEETKENVDLKAKFNEALKNAREAFVKKEYQKSLDYYNESLKYKNSDISYAGMFSVYSAKGETAKAVEMLDKAIKLNPAYTEYWNWKLIILEEKTSASFADLKKIYEDGLTKVDYRTKVNLVTFFANITERFNQKEEAISLWTYAQELYPENKEIYQKEIDRLTE
ncbi:MAG: hypothetical protein UR25_C0005G0041 [Candidatus Nomurabacteria bacterium GW2011_GWE1_32_28]|uniref:Tetratricopeptide repeat protein n=1 Tax=Candidatus Nomurabacteria bacterium GW2011_GWF1_31_48 TaxID=1618767 RepID=A0A0F9YF43_9BACT|nr:MAG: hypothetical protein UR10_C0003G0239 [Candidatus Nomurabacteria bacterium GW2011_GWF2_30_133]KKP28458.1 MAG: hypothetical protein UR18_C0004G0040 [Candidatus Nomurabacteria bacterium GW2011_GWE2_31_40]KKP30038.1 MAG: hypothetical protein UR19_C0005G0040 [Candidatus Nomurabacteria bacterium GW2011_GWF1_31_48]KKP34557.1 MAG: hypothetical protein UR25_C0005G0041 [Candidatus Nomurabacteria bacterium GW2011_GWE1_32_28]HAS81045.1 hypothetical protein [Candidatus Nomurabacteria bacterium]